MAETGHARYAANYAVMITFGSVTVRTMTRRIRHGRRHSRLNSHRSILTSSTNSTSLIVLIVSQVTPFGSIRRCRESPSLAVANHHPINKQIISG